MNQEAIHIFDSELRLIAAEANKYPNAETGGDLYGLFTHGVVPVIWLASGPGPFSKRNGTQFEQDTEFMSRWQATLFDRFGIQYVGSWHSHHQLGLNRPSGGDVAAAQKYAVQHRRSRTLELLVNLESQSHGLVPVLRPYFYDSAASGRHSLLGARVLEGTSPLRPLLGAQAREFQCGLSNGQYYELHDNAIVHKRELSARQSLPEPGLHTSLETLLSQAGIDVEIKDIRGSTALLEIQLKSANIMLSVDFSGGTFVTSAGFVDKVNSRVVPVTDLLPKGTMTFPAAVQSGADLRKLADELARNFPKRGSRKFLGGHR
jgi:hypothetical protein